MISDQSDVISRYFDSGEPPAVLLGVWAHPDDEAYLSAGLMAEVVRAGGRVTLVAVTDGELGFPDDDPRTVGERSELRRSELRAAMGRIGVEDVRFVGASDGFVSRMASDVVAEPIAAVMREIRPDLTVTFGPDGITGHPDHIATGLATTSAWLDVGHGGLAYAAKTTPWLAEWRELHDRVGAWMTDEPEGVAPGDVEISIGLSGAALDHKLSVLVEHASQTWGLAELMGEQVYRRWIADETFRSPRPDDLAAAVVATAWGNPWHPAVRGRSVEVLT